MSNERNPKRIEAAKAALRQVVDACTTAGVYPFIIPDEHGRPMIFVNELSGSVAQDFVCVITHFSEGINKPEHWLRHGNAIRAQALALGAKEELSIGDKIAIGMAVDQAPIDMVLHCPKCHRQHVDEADADNEQTIQPAGVERWTNPPHRSHLCGHCGFIWRPADVSTNGVAAVKTKGKEDGKFDPGYDDCTLTDSQVDGFLCGQGASEDHADFHNAMLRIGLNPATITRLQSKICSPPYDPVPPTQAQIDASPHAGITTPRDYLP